MSNIDQEYSADWYQSLFDRSVDAILVMQGNRFVDCNEAAWRMFGANNKEEILQLEPWQISPESQPDGGASQIRQEDHLAELRIRGTVRFEWEHARMDGTVFPTEVALTVLSEPDADSRMAFGRRETSANEVAEVNQVAADLKGMLGTLLGEDVDLQLQPAAEPLYVRLSASDLEQILMNLISNAVEAVAGRGRISLSSGRRIVDDVPYAAIAVADDGCGMDEGTAARVFEPFFTTKPIGKGTGLGLASVHNLVTQAGGQISVDSETGTGTTFSILLPLRSAAVEALPFTGEKNQTQNVRPLSGLQVLVVDDDAAAGTIVLNVLKDAGCEGQQVHKAAQALELVREHPFDLIIADVVMPDMSGPELIAALDQRQNKIPVVLMSGHTENRLEAFAIDTSGLQFLQKPFTPQQLIECVDFSVQAVS